MTYSRRSSTPTAGSFGFVYLNPKYPDESVAEFDRCVRDGPMVGVKLWIAERCSHENLDPICRRAAQLKVPVLQHTSSYAR